jgi:uncharacterized protein (TIGR03086 family)
LQRANASTAAVLADVSPDQYDAVTPCEGWTVRDVINHFMAASYAFGVAARTGAMPTDDASGQAPDFTRGDLVSTFAGLRERAEAAFAAEGAMERTMTLPIGTVPGRVALTIAATDAFVHGWDLAASTGQSTDLDPELAEELLSRCRRLVPDELRSAVPGATPFGPAVDAGPDASAADRLAAFLGRRKPG